MVGRTVNQYQFLAKLGAGGMGEIYKAQDTRLNRFVAVKVLTSANAGDPDRRRRFLQEAQAASALNHPNIITIHDIITEGDAQFMVMEYVQGKTLVDLIPKGGLRVPQVIKYSMQMADALQSAHAAGIIHRDLKPGNVMATESGLVKVLDFGLAKLTDNNPFGKAGFDDATRTIADAPLTVEGSIIGTVSYMSPEQAQGRKVDPRSDIFSAGLVMYEMATGARAFTGDSALSTLSSILRDEARPMIDFAPDVPAELEQIISRCLRKMPEDRWQNMKDLQQALSALKFDSESGVLLRSRLSGIVAPGQFLVPAGPPQSPPPQSPAPPMQPTPSMMPQPGAPQSGFQPPVPQAPLSQQGMVSQMPPPPMPPQPPYNPQQPSYNPQQPVSGMQQPPSYPGMPPPPPQYPGPPSQYPGVMPPPMQQQQPPPKKKGSGMILGLVGILLLLGGVGGAGWWWTHRKPAEPEPVAVVQPPPDVQPTPAPPPPEPEPAATTPPTPDAAKQVTTTAKALPPPTAAKQPAPQQKGATSPPPPAPTQTKSTQPTATTPTTPAQPVQTTPAPSPAPSTPSRTAPPVMASVVIGDALPFTIALAQDIPNTADEGMPLRFTATSEFRVGDTLVVAKGATVTGQIAEGAKKRLVGSSKITLRLTEAEAVGGAKFHVRALPGRRNDGKYERPAETNDSKKTKDIAAAAGTVYVAYIDGEQTINVRK